MTNGNRPRIPEQPPPTPVASTHVYRPINNTSSAPSSEGVMFKSVYVPKTSSNQFTHSEPGETSEGLRKAPHQFFGPNHPVAAGGFPGNIQHSTRTESEFAPNHQPRYSSDGPRNEGRAYEVRNEGRAYDVATEDAEGKKTRGKTILADVWNLPKGTRIVVESNKANQPIGDEGGVLGNFCETIARNGDLCSLSYTRWDYLKKGNKGNNLTMIMNEIKERFLYPASLQKWILQSIGHKWRDHKCLLKGQQYSDTASLTELHNKCPDDVRQDQWVSLVNFWRSDEGQKRSRISRMSLEKAKTKPIHTAGTKSHARICEELRKTLQRSPTRTELYLECHQHTKEVDVTDRIKEIAAQQGDLEVNLNEDAVAQVLGKDEYGRVRGFGLGVKPSALTKSSGSSYFSTLNMSSAEETSSMFLIRQLKDELQTLKEIVLKQGKILTKLKRKRNNDGYNSNDLHSSDSGYGDSSSEKEPYDDSDEEQRHVR